MRFHDKSNPIGYFFPTVKLARNSNVLPSPYFHFTLMFFIMFWVIYCRREFESPDYINIDIPILGMNSFFSQPSLFIINTNNQANINRVFKASFRNLESICIKNSNTIKSMMYWDQGYWIEKTMFFCHITYIWCVGESKWEFYIS